jgi:hypothetical protein
LHGDRRVLEAVREGRNWLWPATRGGGAPDRREQILERAPLEHEVKRARCSNRARCSGLTDDDDAHFRIEGLQSRSLARTGDDRIGAVEEYDAGRVLRNGCDEVVLMTNYVDNEATPAEEKTRDWPKAAVRAEEEYSNGAQGMHRVGRAVMSLRRQQLTLTRRARAKPCAKVGPRPSFRRGLSGPRGRDAL